LAQAQARAAAEFAGGEDVETQITRMTAATGQEVK